MTGGVGWRLPRLCCVVSTKLHGHVLLSPSQGVFWPYTKASHLTWCNTIPISLGVLSLKFCIMLNTHLNWLSHLLAAALKRLVYDLTARGVVHYS